MATTLVNKYVWLINKLSIGKWTLKEICHAWASQSDLNSDNKELNRRTFFKWRFEIKERFRINIQCRKVSGEYIYYIDRQPGEETINNWLLKTISIENTISSYTDISSRIILEDVPSGENNLQIILGAIRESKCISFTYSDYWEDTVSISIKPYFVKLFRQRWHVIGPIFIHEDGYDKDRKLTKKERALEYGSIKSYALDNDRLYDLRVLEARFNYPNDFCPNDFYYNNYSTLKDNENDNPVSRIRVLVWEKQNFYFRSVPLHHSQQEIYTSKIDGYSIFEYYLQPTLDFLMDLRSFGNYVEVLEPKSLRNVIVQDAKDVIDEYKGLSRMSCKEDVPFVVF